MYGTVRGSGYGLDVRPSKALGRLQSRGSLSSERAELSRDDERRIASFEPRASVASLPVVLASSGFVESASPFQSARSQLTGRQKLARQSVLI